MIRSLTRSALRHCRLAQQCLHVCGPPGHIVAECTEPPTPEQGQKPGRQKPGRPLPHCPYRTAMQSSLRPHQSAPWQGGPCRGGGPVLLLVSMRLTGLATRPTMTSCDYHSSRFRHQALQRLNWSTSTSKIHACGSRSPITSFWQRRTIVKGDARGRCPLSPSNRDPGARCWASPSAMLWEPPLKGPPGFRRKTLKSLYRNPGSCASPMTPT